MKKALFILLITVFTVNFIHANWNEVQKLLAGNGEANDWFGYSVSIDGDYAVVGAYLDDNNEFVDAGAAYVFHWDGSTWNPQTTLNLGSGGEDSYFGRPVSISGDYIIVGSSHDDERGHYAGCAYIFHREGTSWIYQAKLLGADTTEEDQFGLGVAISGNYAVVGSRFDDDNGMDSGSAYVFLRDGIFWEEEAKLTASDGNAFDLFGWCVAIDGSYVIVGSTWDDDNGINSGSAYVFYGDGTSWTEQAKLTANDGAEGDYFGSSVDISGSYALVGACYDDDRGVDSGSAYLYRRYGSIWIQYDKLLANDVAGDDLFGYTVAIDGNNAVVGAIGDDDLGGTSGSAYVFHCDDDTWSQRTKLLASDGSVGDNFGSGVDISGGNVLVGACWDDVNGNASGSAYIFSYFTPGTGSASGRPAEGEALEVPVEPLDPYNYLGDSSTFVVEPDVEIDPEESGATITVDVAVINNSYGGFGLDHASLSYMISLTGTDYPVEVVLHYDGLPFSPDELVYFDGGWRRNVNVVSWDHISQTVTFVWTFDSLDRDGIGYFMINDGFGSMISGCGYYHGQPAEGESQQVEAEPLESHDYDGNGPVIVLPGLFITPSEYGDTLTIYIFIESGNSEVPDTTNASLTYTIRLTGTVDSVQVVLYFTDLPFTPDELVWFDGVTWQIIYRVVWDPDEQTATFFWTFDPDTAIFVMNNGEETTLPVELSGFSATMTAESYVQLEWITQSESDMLGYHVQRGENDDPAQVIRLTVSPIEAHNQSQENSYRFVDVEVEKDCTYYYWLESVEMNGSVQFFGPVSITIIEEDPEVPPSVYEVTALDGNYPNPFNPETTIRYSLGGMAGETEPVSIVIYNTRGQKVRTLIDGLEEPGQDKTVVWNGTDDYGKPVSNGVYLYRLRTDNRSQVRKMLMMK